MTDDQPRDEPSAEATEAMTDILLSIAEAYARSDDVGYPDLRAEFRIHLDVFAARRVAEAVAAEREACARLVSQHPFADDATADCHDAQGCCEMLAAQIRARREQSHD